MIGMEAFLGDYKMCPQISRTHTGAGRPKGVRRSLCLGLIQFPVWMEVPFLLWVPVECFLWKVLWSLGVLDGDVEGSASARAFDWHGFIYLYAGSAASGAANGMEVTKGASLQWKKTPNSEVWHKCKWFGGCLLRGVLCQLEKLLPQNGEDGGCVRTNLEAEVLHPWTR